MTLEKLPFGWRAQNALNKKTRDLRAHLVVKTPT